jgi:hypothetical protein
MLRKTVSSDILTHFAHCLTKNLPLSSSENRIHSKYFQLCTKITSWLMLLCKTRGS